MSSTLPRPLVTVSTLNNPPSSDTIVASSPLAAIAPDRRPHLQSGEDLTPLKRRKISPDMFEPTAPVPQSPCIPIAAVLYHYAQVAHQTSHVHLQQAFVPTHISTDRSSGYSIIKLYSSSSSTQQNSSSNRFNHDPQAFAKALGLQLYALDLLRAGLGMNNLSDMERVAFSLEFGVVGIKVYMAQQQILQSKSKGKEKEKMEGAQVVDCQRLMDDMQDIVGQANEARRNNHQMVVQLALLIKTRIAFVHRRWELVPTVLAELAASIGWSDSSPSTDLVSDQKEERTWLACLNIHYLILRALWEGRVGNDSVAKEIMKRAYALMDETADKKVFNELRANGGVITLHIPNSRPLQVQTTPPNILYMLTYLTTVVARRDFTGSNATCKSIVHPTVMRETENIARTEDMWDSGFSSLHSLSQAIALRRQVMSIKGEVMIEQAAAMIYRSCFAEGRQLLYETVEQLLDHNLFHPLSPHLCLTFAQHAHHLGLTSSAVRYYKACKDLINSGSELSLIAEIGLLAVQNKLEGLDQSVERQDEVNALAEKCKGSSSAMFSATGYFLASLTDDNRVNSKKKLSTAYEISQKANNNILRLLIFAFTTSTHHYGGRERMLRQLETGRDISKILGGKDRDDGVGQVVLGMWFARRLKEFYRQEGYQQGVQVAKESEKLHFARLNDLRREAEKVAKGEEELECGR
ncbi:Hypothetical Protein CGB_L1630C [Cryptococcus gattii WM276]|uniref:Cohesin loading factor n=1 Tax=Cryptococcus gattii serotype B (strain WM276 / ATCC MYA-4071) TaxID=367775 RepID=E6REU1_CRYGW|nr:Hypothetical Protein CGB_L1630C [Cryptococcus gattii WM276]ADV25198.1 Hypothetical Protein CGB_L1630C [Cryptococcus gattii WM276]